MNFAGPTTHTLVVSALVCMAAAALSGTATPLLKRATLRMEPLSITAGMHAAAVLMLLPGALYDLPQAHFTLSAVAAVAVLGIATLGLAYWMFMRIILFSSVTQRKITQVHVP